MFEKIEKAIFDTSLSDIICFLIFLKKTGFLLKHFTAIFLNFCFFFSHFFYIFFLIIVFKFKKSFKVFCLSFQVQLGYKFQVPATYGLRACERRLKL